MGMSSYTEEKTQQEPSAFDENEPAQQTRAVIPRGRRPSAARQEKLAELAGKEEKVPEIVIDPPTTKIQRRTSERLITAIPRKSRGSQDFEVPSITIEEDSAEDKRAPETPRAISQDNESKREPKSPPLSVDTEMEPINNEGGD